MEAVTHTPTDRASSTAGPSGSLRRSIARFTLHYGEMVAVMFAGMGVFAAALAFAGTATAYGGTELKADAPALFLAGMGLSMTTPMVWWMRRRGHSRPANTAMALSMIAPTVAVIALLAAELSTDPHGLLMVQHTVMLPAMLVAMLPFRAEFTRTH